MTSSQHGPYVQGYTHPTMAGTMGSDLATGSKSRKTRLSSDWGLQFDPMKLESLVIAGQQTAVNTFSVLVHTARQANKVGGARNRCANPQGGQPPTANSMMGTKS